MGNLLWNYFDLRYLSVPLSVASSLLIAQSNKNGNEITSLWSNILCECKKTCDVLYRNFHKKLVNESFEKEKEWIELVDILTKPISDLIDDQIDNQHDFFYF